jgi:hypothetical protein
MDPSTPVRKLKLKGKSTESIVARVGNISVVRIRSSDLAKKAHVGSAAQGVIHDPDGLGYVKGDLIRIGVDAGLLRNGNGLGPDRCRENVRQPLLVGNWGRAKLSVKDDAGFFGNFKSFG